MVVRLKGATDPYGKFKDVAMRKKSPGNIPAEMLFN